jgi:hypothetical protein
MNAKLTKLLACALLLAAVFLFIRNQDEPKQEFEHVQVNPQMERGSVNRAPADHADAIKTPQPKSEAMAAESNALTKEEMIEVIHDASVSYDPRELPKIRPFLTHENAEVRKAAVDGMVILGDASAGEMIREAAKSAPTPQEAVAMLQAADYVELPSARAVLRSKKKADE